MVTAYYIIACCKTLLTQLPLNLKISANSRLTPFLRNCCCQSRSPYTARNGDSLIPFVTSGGQKSGHKVRGYESRKSLRRALFLKRFVLWARRFRLHIPVSYSWMICFYRGALINCQPQLKTKAFAKGWLFVEAHQAKHVMKSIS